MKPSFFFICAMIFSLNIKAQYNLDNLKLDNFAQQKLLYKNLRIYPVKANTAFILAHKNIGNYTNLKEAMEKKLVVITEKIDSTSNRNSADEHGETISSNGEVNSLFVENISEDTVILMAGEVVAGGKQDRVLAQDMILPPKSGRLEIPVFCVEHGRWSTEKTGYQFANLYGVSSNNVRKEAAVEKDQQAVWEQVAVTRENNKKFSRMDNPDDAYSTTDAYTDLAADSTYMNTMNEYMQYFGAMFHNDSTVIGVVAVTGDKIIGCDMFATNQLFRKQFPALVQSYITEACTNGAEVTVTDEKVQQYLSHILGDENKQEERVKKSGIMLKTNSNKKLHIATF